MKCIHCGQIPKQSRIDLVEVGKKLGRFTALVCTCGERYYSEYTAKKIQVKEKQLGIFGVQQ